MVLQENSFARKDACVHIEKSNMEKGKLQSRRRVYKCPLYLIFYVENDYNKGNISCKDGLDKG